MGTRCKRQSLPFGFADTFGDLDTDIEFERGVRLHFSNAIVATTCMTWNLLSVAAHTRKEPQYTQETRILELLAICIFVE